MTEELAVLIVTRRPAKEMADGTLRVQIDVEPNDRRKFLDMFPDNGDPIAVAALEPDAVRAHQNKTAFAEPEPKREPNKFAQWLKQSGFFRKPDVWAFCGTDDDFLEWLKTQTCAAEKITPDRCDGDVVPAHVRRIAEGAGTARKPQSFCAIPLCNKHHCQQHQHGESHFADKTWFDQKRVEVVERWAWDRFKLLAGIDSMSKLTPYHLESILRGSNINVNIPTEYL